MAQGRSTEIIWMIKRIGTGRFSVKNSLSRRLAPAREALDEQIDALLASPLPGQLRLSIKTLSKKLTCAAAFSGSLTATFLV